MVGWSVGSRKMTGPCAAATSRGWNPGASGGIYNNHRALGTVMARRRKLDKLVKHDNLWAATNAKQRLVQVRKIDIDSVPAGYVKGFKISCADNTSESSTLTYSFYACLDEDATFSENRIIDHLVLSPGGGTGYLNVNRKVWKNDNPEPAPVGGPVTIWGECSDAADSTTYTITAYTARLELVNV